LIIHLKSGKNKQFDSQRKSPLIAGFGKGVGEYENMSMAVDKRKGIHDTIL